MQVIFLNISNLLVLVYHGLAEPFETRTARRLDYFNEACLSLITYFLFMYGDFIPDEELKYLIGWAQVCVLGLNIFVNCFGVLRTMVKDTYRVLRLNYWRLVRKIAPHSERRENGLKIRGSE